jgi:hypothetical protein
MSLTGTEPGCGGYHSNPQPLGLDPIDTHTHTHIYIREIPIFGLVYKKIMHMKLKNQQREEIEVVGEAKYAYEYIFFKL